MREALVIVGRSEADASLAEEGAAGERMPELR